VNQNLMIKIPTIQSTTSFAEVLESGLIQYINQNGLNTIRVEVPKKYIQKISTYAAQFGDNTFTTIEVEADDIVGKAEVSILSDAGKESKVLTTKSNNKYIFIFADVQPNSTLQVDVFNTSGELVESSFNKLAKGNKVFSDVPKSPMEGSYSLYSLLTDKTLLSNIFKYYSLEDLKIGTLR